MTRFHDLVLFLEVCCILHFECVLLFYQLGALVPAQHLSNLLFFIFFQQLFVLLQLLSVFLKYFFCNQRSADFGLLALVSEL